MRVVQFKTGWLILLTYFLLSCANVVTPTGGPKDETPPKVVSFLPDNNTVLFNQKEIRIFFDEFVSLNKVNEEVLISPPLSEKPDIKIKGRSVLISFNEELRDSTTYSISFGNSIKDITEGNIIEDLVYSFSTGSKMDEFSLKGQIVDAYSKEAEKSMTVMLYNEDTDSLPLTTKPLYISKTDDLGNFQFFNLADQPYKIFALGDINANMIYDNPEERIAFLDSMIEANPPPPKPDTTQTDSTSLTDLVNDTLLTIPTVLDTILPQKVYRLYSFKQMDTLQRLLTFTALNENQIRLIYNLPTLNFEINSLNGLSQGEDYKIEMNTSQDTIDLWLFQKDIDTLSFISQVEGLNADTSKVVTNTASFASRGKKSSPGPVAIRIKPNTTSSSFLEYPWKLVLSFDYPIIGDSLPDRIVLDEDSLSVLYSWKYQNSSLKKKLDIEADFKENTNYHLKIPPRTFFSIGDYTNDTLNILFKTRKLEDYGKLKMNINLPLTNPLIVLVLNEKGVELNRIRLSQTDSFNIDNMVPGMINVKCFVDENGNGRWDSGNYHLLKQAEKVYEITNPITIKSNFTQDIDWVPKRKDSQ